MVDEYMYIRISDLDLEYAKTFLFVFFNVFNSNTDIFLLFFGLYA